MKTNYLAKVGENKADDFRGVGNSMDIVKLSPQACGSEHIHAEITNLRAKDEKRTWIDRLVRGESDAEKSAKTFYKEIVETEGRNHIEFISKSHSARMAKLDLYVEAHLNSFKLECEDNHIRDASQRFKDRAKMVNDLRNELNADLIKADTEFLNNLEKADENLARAQARKDNYLYDRLLRAKHSLIDSHSAFCEQLVTNFTQVISYTAGGGIGYFNQK